MKFLLAVVFVIIVTDAYTQVSASASAQATITGPEGMYLMEYNEKTATLHVQVPDNTSYDRHIRLPDSLVNLATKKKVAVNCNLDDCVYQRYEKYGYIESQIQTIFISDSIQNGVYQNDLQADDSFITIYYY